jgi:hypothetical protein
MIMWLVFNNYKVEKKVEEEVSFPNLVEWVQGAVMEHQHHGMPMEDLDVDALSCPPKTNYIEVSMDEGIWQSLPSE